MPRTRNDAPRGGRIDTRFAESSNGAAGEAAAVEVDDREAVGVAAVEAGALRADSDRCSPVGDEQATSREPSSAAVSTVGHAERGK